VFKAALQKPPCHDSSHGGRSNTSKVANNPSDTTSTNNVPRTSDKEGVAYKACTGLLQERVLDELSLLTKNWKGSIVLSCVPMTALEGVEKAKEEPVDIDICDYLSGQKTQYSRLNFSPRKYPPPADLGLAFKTSKKNHTNTTWDDLRTHIVKQSYKTRSPVICSSGSSGGGGKKFVCHTLNDTNKKNKGRKREDEDFRETHLVNDGERGERENGRSLPRRTSGQDISDGKCGLLFTVKCDEIGYHITLFRSAGTCMHSHHIKYNYSDVSLPLRLLEENEFKELKNVHDTQAGEGLCKAYLFAKTGQLVPRGKIAYLFGSKATGDADFASDIDKLLSYLEDEKDIVHAVFWDMASRGNDGCRLVSKCKCVEDEDPIVTDLTADRSMKKVVAMVREDRKERNIGSNQNLFLSVMWGEKENLRYFKMYPETVFVDVTSHSNNKKYHLLTFSCKSGTNKQVLFLKAWIPNQRRFSFRWVFKYGMESLGLHHYFKYTELIMKDGDPQQHNEIQNFMVEYLTNAFDGACGWHLVRQGCLRDCPGKTAAGKENAEKWEQFLTHVKNWLYSWMRPGYCETEDEYKISKELLFRYISSESALQAAGGHQQLLDTVKRWVQNKVIVSENHFLFYLRKHKRAFHTYCSNGHEGTNFGMKNHTIPLKANGSMTKNAKALTMQASLKAAEMNANAYRNVIKPNKKWSKLPTAPYVTPFAEGLVHAIMDRQDLYSVRRVGEREFEIKCSICVEPFIADHSVSEDKCPIPRFHRIRRVVVDDDGVCRCSCCYFEQVGIPCPHMAKVFDTVQPQWDGFLHTDVSVRWWSQYNYSAYQFPGHGNLTQLFHDLRHNDVKGPKLHLDLLTDDCMPIEDPSTDMSAVHRLKNYDVDDISQQLGGTVDGCIVTTSAAQSEMERNMLESNGGIPDAAIFSESLEDFQFRADGSLPPGVSLRSALMPQFNDVCRVCEQFPQLRQKLSEAHEDILKHGRKLASEKMSNPERNGATVSMLTDRHTGPSRVYNTKINPI